MIFQVCELCGRDRASKQLLLGSLVPARHVAAGKCKKQRAQLLTEVKSLRVKAIKHSTNSQLLGLLPVTDSLGP